MPRLLHRKRRGAAPLTNTAEGATSSAGASGGLKVSGESSAVVDVPRSVEGRGGAGAASAAGEVLAAVWDLPPLGGHEGAAAELREELCRLAAVAVEQRKKEEELDLRQNQIERMEAEHKSPSQQRSNKKENHALTRNQLQEQLKSALAKIEKLTADLNKLTELEDDFKTQLENLATNREKSEKKHQLSLDAERKRWQEQEAKYLTKIEELRNFKGAEDILRSEISELQNDCNAKGEVIAKLESQVSTLQTSNEVLNESVRNLQEEIEALEIQSDDLRAHIEHLERTVVRKSDEEVHVLTRKVEELVERDRKSDGVILELRQAVCHLEASDSENQEVNADLNARVQAAEIEVLGAASLRVRLVQFLDGISNQDGLQNDEDILTAVTNVFNKFKMEEDHCHQRMEELQERVTELESNKLYFPDQDIGAKEMIDSLHEKLAQSQGAEQDARAMLEELQAKLRYFEATERQDKDVLLKAPFAANPEHIPEQYQLEPPPDQVFHHPEEILGPHPLEMQHQFFQPHIHPSQIQFHVPYPEFGFQLRKDIPSRHHLQPMQPIPTLQPLQVSMPAPQPQLTKGMKKTLRQCFKCQKFGHLAKQCSGETTCVVCGVRGHTHNECNTNEARCANCQGPHRASSKTCPVRINWCSNANREGDAQLAQS